jgi:hypothetical protein
MAEFSIVAVTVSSGSEEAEIDVITAAFESADEAMGYARRMAEETHRLAAQLELDMDYSQVAVFEGETPEEVDFDSPALVGAWLYDEDGVGWSTAAALRESDPTGGDA